MHCIKVKCLEETKDGQGMRGGLDWIALEIDYIYEL